MGKQQQKSPFKCQLGMNQVSATSQQVSTGSQKLAELAQTTARQAETLKKIMDEAGTIAKETSATADEASQRAMDANVKGQKGIAAINSIKNDVTKVAEAVSSMVGAIDKGWRTRYFR